jgi:2-iminobutanoate/2-iminopropanoate deaminase
LYEDALTNTLRRKGVIAKPRRTKGEEMSKSIEHVHWPDAPDMWMPYAPAIKVRGGTTVYLAGVTAAPVYHHHPHRPEEFDSMPLDMAGQARAALENL